MGLFLRAKAPSPTPLVLIPTAKALTIADLCRPMADRFGFVEAEVSVCLEMLYEGRHISYPTQAIVGDGTGAPIEEAMHLEATLVTIGMNAEHTGVDFNRLRNYQPSPRFYVDDERQHGAIMPRPMSQQSLKYSLSKLGPNPTALYWVIVRTFLDKAVQVISDVNPHESIYSRGQI